MRIGLIPQSRCGMLQLRQRAIGTRHENRYLQWFCEIACQCAGPAPAIFTGRLVTGGPLLIDFPLTDFSHPVSDLPVLAKRLGIDLGAILHVDAYRRMFKTI